MFFFKEIFLKIFHFFFNFQGYARIRYFTTLIKVVLIVLVLQIAVTGGSDVFDSVNEDADWNLFDPAYADEDDGTVEGTGYDYPQALHKTYKFFYAQMSGKLPGTGNNQRNCNMKNCYIVLSYASPRRSRINHNYLIKNTILVKNRKLYEVLV